MYRPTTSQFFLTKNGVGAIVVMSMKAYEAGLYEREVYDKLREAELQSRSTTEHFSHEDVMAAARKRLDSIAAKEKQRA